MKISQFLSFGAALVLVVAQNPDSLPACGKLCVNNMLAKAKELGCADNDAACLCRNVDFAYGIRDCSTDVCGPTEAITVITYGENYCKSAGTSGTGGTGGTSGTGNGNVTSTISGPIATSTGVLPPPSSSVSLPQTTVTASKTVTGAAFTTSAILSTVTSGSEVYTTTLGFTTVVSSPSGTATHSGSSSSDSPSTQSGSETSSSSGSGARQTAFAGLAAAAGLAAMIL